MKSINDLKIMNNEKIILDIIEMLSIFKLGPSRMADNCATIGLLYAGLQNRCFHLIEEGVWKSDRFADSPQHLLNNK